jgi:hypothetical protein
MMLWDANLAEIDYCLVSTPLELCVYEDQNLHQVDHIPEKLRVTRVPSERDRSLEDKIIERVTHAQAYYTEAIERILKHHNL